MMLYRSWPIVGVLSMWATGVLASSSTPVLSGTYQSPLGRLAVAEKSGIITATVLDAKNPCGFPRGSVVLHGNRLEDSIVGTLRVCQVRGPGCDGSSEGAAMLLITRSGARMSGAVHLDVGACQTPLKDDALVLTRVEPTPHKASKAKAPKTDDRPRAESLAAEGNAMMNSNEGNAEAARAKFEEAVQVSPTYAEGYVGVGVTYYVRDRYDEALEWYKRALDVNPSLGDAYYNIGCVYALKGEHEQALRYLRIALLNGYVQLDTLKTDPDLKGLEGNGKFERLKQGLTE